VPFAVLDLHDAGLVGVARLCHCRRHGHGGNNLMQKEDKLDQNFNKRNNMNLRADLPKVIL
jgi:hypothetical protein